MNMMTYQETIDYIYSQLPMFHREGKTAYKANLDNILNLVNKLGNPQNKFKSIHIAGTNGKGSVSHMLASVLQEHGFKTGLFTSPHLIDFRERIKINGELIPEENVISFIEKYKLYLDNILPSFFEMTTAMAFEYFANENVDIAVIETGLGGRLDSTNVLIPVISGITNISLDHTDILGDTLEKIAAEKAGIIKLGIPVVIGEFLAQTKPVFLEKANRTGSKIIFAEDCYKPIKSEIRENEQVITLKNLKKDIDEIYYLDLLGDYQKKNICTTLTIIDELRGELNLTQEKIHSALKHAAKRTGLMGRWQIIGQNPLIIADTGHNYEGLKNVTQQLKRTKFDKLFVVFGMVKDKDINIALSVLPTNAEYLFTKAAIPRALDENILKSAANAIGLKGEAYSAVFEALYQAKNLAGKNDCIYIGGSTFIVAEALKIFTQKF